MATKLLIVKAFNRGSIVTMLAQEFSVSRQAIYNILNKFKSGGEKGLETLPSIPHNLRTVDKAVLSLVRKRCLERPDLSNSALCGYLKTIDNVILAESTMSKYIRLVGLNGVSHKMLKLECLFEGRVSKTNPIQLKFLTRHNPSYSDFPLSSKRAVLVLHLGYFLYQTAQGRNVYICVCIDEKSGFVDVMNTEMLESSIFSQLLRRVLKRGEANSIVVIVPNAKNKQFILSPNIYGNTFNGQNELQSAKKHGIECGMFNRFEKSFRHKLSTQPKIAGILRGDLIDLPNILNLICVQWNSSPLLGFPTYGKSPDSI